MEVVVGKTTVYRYDGEYGTSYSIGLKKKKQDGSYEMGFVSVKFKKDVDIPTKTEIEVPEHGAWLSFNTKNGKTFTYIFINEFTIVEKQEEQKEEMPRTIKSEDIDVNDMLPF